MSKLSELNRTLWLSGLAAGGLAAALASCSGDDGERGAPGPSGAQGPQGPAGPAGPGGGDAGVIEGGLTSSCMSPCHGFTGLVEQWKTSTHFSAFIANLGGEEVESWTGARACGNCHAIDGIQQRFERNVNPFFGDGGPPDPLHVAQGQINYASPAAAEANYAGKATVAVVHCTTCHTVDANNDPHKTGQDYTRGSFPLRVPSGANDEAWLEKSSAIGTVDGTAAGKYGVGNACMWCHKSRKDVTNYIPSTSTNVRITSVHWGPHEGPHADIYTGKGGYHYTGKSYGNSSHQNFTNGCVRCHMPEYSVQTGGQAVVQNQGIGNHSFYAQLSSCKSAGCHENTNTFDVIGGQSLTISRIQELRVALNDAGLLTRAEAAPYATLTADELIDQDFTLDEPRPQPADPPVSPDKAGAVYNYLIIARGSAGGIHNPLYTRQLIWDSLQAIEGAAPSYPRPGGP
ncbi:MAG TPA: hypothetical protein VK524_20280 [Polyangiaceae bacterium]|nr:hypothetical protein [Polyangiaceae bacterium]